MTLTLRSLRLLKKRRNRRQWTQRNLHFGCLWWVWWCFWAWTSAYLVKRAEHRMLRLFYRLNSGRIRCSLYWAALPWSGIPAAKRIISSNWKLLGGHHVSVFHSWWGSIWRMVKWWPSTFNRQQCVSFSCGFYPQYMGCTSLVASFFWPLFSLTHSCLKYTQKALFSSKCALLTAFLADFGYICSSSYYWTRKQTLLSNHGKHLNCNRTSSRKSVWDIVSPMNASYGNSWCGFLLSDAFTFSALLITYGLVRSSHAGYDGAVENFVFSQAYWPIPEKVFDAVPFFHGLTAPLVFVGLMTFIWLWAL